MSKLQEAKKEYDDNWSAQATGYYLKELEKSNAEMREALIEAIGYIEEDILKMSKQLEK